jgi:threonine/homoserine/homoserine lactone efflux protein
MAAMPVSFLKGLAFGFLLAGTVGPLWILCFRRTLAHGRLFGFVSGMGVATADAIYGFVAAFGLTAVSNFLLAQKFWLGLVGGAFLCWLGVKTLLARPGDRPADAPATGLAAAYGSTLALTLTNPATILAFVAIFAGLGLASSGSYAEASLVVLGVVLGSASWWVLLALGAGWLRARSGPRLLRAVNVFAGVSILAFGVVQLVSLAV